MCNIHRQIMTLSLLTAALMAMAVCSVAGCAKKSGPEAIPETRDTLTVISDTLSKTHDTLSETLDTLSEIPNTLTDTRDGMTYRTVTFGKRTWMAENLNYETDSSWCYNDSDSYCHAFGRLYNWDAAMKACPQEWHLSTNAEWDTLLAYVSDNRYIDEFFYEYYRDIMMGLAVKLNAGYGIHDNVHRIDTSGFSALPSGLRGHDGTFDMFGMSHWWTATENEYSSAYARCIGCWKSEVLDAGMYKGNGYSVRCVRDKSAADVSSQKSVDDDKAKIEMAFVKGGTFRMGCTSEQGSDCNDNEKPAHSITVSDFYIGKYEVTQNQWVQVMGGNNPSYFKGGNLPVEQVGWNDVQRFILRLNSITGKKYRLPTEAEWEYAARGGASSKGYKYSGSNSANDVAWSNVNSGNNVLKDGLFKEYIKKNDDLAGYDKILDSNKNRTRAVGTKSPNELGIYDMSGNVFEWVSDLYGDYRSAAQTNPRGPTSSLYRMFRGGGWTDDARYCRVSYRSSDLLGSGNKSLGFRLVLSP